MPNNQNRDCDCDCNEHDEQNEDKLAHKLFEANYNNDNEIGFGSYIWQAADPLPDIPGLREAGGEGFFGPGIYGPMQNPIYGIFMRNRILHHTLAVRGSNGISKVLVITPGAAKPAYERDLAKEGVTHLFGAVPFFSEQTLTWKLACMTFPKNEFGTGDRCFFYEDTGITLT